jgi:putative Holliday junction resolvase
MDERIQQKRNNHSRDRCDQKDAAVVKSGDYHAGCDDEDRKIKSRLAVRGTRYGFNSLREDTIKFIMRVLALDLGKKRIGIAVSDELGFTAQGMETLRCVNQRTDLAAIAKIAREKGAGLVLIGNPLNMTGQVGAQAEWVHAYAARIAEYTGLEVKLWDERLTSAEANRFLREGGLSVDRKTGTVDRMAAVILLQSYLDSLAHAPVPIQ